MYGTVWIPRTNKLAATVYFFFIHSRSTCDHNALPNTVIVGSLLILTMAARKNNQRQKLNQTHFKIMSILLENFKKHTHS
jgi:hypothetical protein